MITTPPPDAGQPEIVTLPPKLTLNKKFDAYCHVCWNAVYVLWIDDLDPGGRCPTGCKKATDCEEAMERARFTAHLLRVKEGRA